MCDHLDEVCKGTARQGWQFFKLIPQTELERHLEEDFFFFIVIYQINNRAKVSTKFELMRVYCIREMQTSIH